MKEDFNKIVTESPRAGGNLGQKEPKGYRRNLQRMDEDDHPSHESMTKKWKGNPKEFTDHIQPLVRFMDKQVGKNWDKVQSEICKTFPKKGTMNLHIWDHIKDMIITPENIKFIEGVPYEKSRWGWRNLTKGELWVHPKTNVIQRAKEYKKAKVKPIVTYVQDDAMPMVQYHLIDGDWYKITLATYSSDYLSPYHFGRVLYGDSTSIYTTYPGTVYEAQELGKLFGRLNVWGKHKQKLYPDRVKELGLYKKLAELNK